MSIMSRQAHKLAAGLQMKPFLLHLLPEDTKLVSLALAFALILALIWWFNLGAKKWLIKHGLLDEWEPSRLDELAIKATPQQKMNCSDLKYSTEEFQEMVSDALDDVPEEFDKEWKNVAVIVSTDWPSEADKKRMGIPQEHLLLGMYSGIAKTQGSWSESSRHVVVIYQPALEWFSGGDKQRLEEQIRKTVLHELAHHLGMSHERMKEIGL
jgi:predicted Zn-dependent protease with MMP-like domain